MTLTSAAHCHRCDWAESGDPATVDRAAAKHTKRHRAPDRGGRDTATEGKQLNDQQQKEVPQFAHVLHQINRGALADEAAAELAALVQEVTHIGHKGTLTITVVVAPNGTGDTIQLSGHVTVKPPARDPHAGVFFFTEDGALSRNDPSRNTLFDADGSATQ